MKSFRELWGQGGFDKGWISWVLSMLVMMVLFYPTGIAHELGHGVVCHLTDGEIYWPWVFTKLSLLCDPFPEHVKEISWFMGGSFGIIASITPIFVFKFIKKQDWILNGFLGCAFMQLGYAVMESTQNELYKSNDLSVLIPIVFSGSLAIVFFTCFISKIRKFSHKK